MESSQFTKFYQENMNQIKHLFNEKSGQFMLVGLDLAVLNYALQEIKKNQTYKFIEVKKDKDESPNNKVFVIRLNALLSVEYQSLLYFYFELPLYYDCFVCIITTSSNALNYFEKRVSSRFKNKILFFPYYQERSSESSRSIVNNIAAKECILLGTKYNLEEFSLEFMLDLFDPIHLSIIMMSFLQKIDPIKVYDQFKLATMNTLELKKADSVRVFQCSLDIIESGVLNEKGIPMIDYNEFKSFVYSKCPMYLRSLLRALNKIKK